MALTFLHPALAPDSSTRSQPISIIGQESSLVYWSTIERSPKLMEPFITSIPPTRMARGTMATAMADCGVHQLTHKVSKEVDSLLKRDASLENLSFSFSSFPKDFTVRIPIMASLAAWFKSALLSEMLSDNLSPFFSLFIAKNAIIGMHTSGTTPHFQLTLTRAKN